MPLIHIETQPVSVHTFEFIQTWIDDQGVNLDEHTYTEKAESRMYAAMTNLGYACRWLNDALASRGAVCIVSDRDGRDVKFGGEHDDLYNAIHSQNDYQRNRTKYGLIYGKYLSYLDRIRDLANLNEITFTQDATVTLGLNRGREQFALDPNDPNLPRNRGFTRENLLHISMKGNKNIVACRACTAFIEYKQTDEFIPYAALNATRTRTVRVKSNKQMIAMFLEKHLSLHGIK